ncbi:differentially expressed in FDCP 8 homolog A isoform X2 [Ischnura elegans]|uniref:differentially expressed in FDCP 8 homolog A isoform X2 n=1 Tax=Ischnura elegans TaxID=197161 RepID=UPI001ED89EB9|nr:differentially expressed in FDCP 8 homolog A isoform X2 [Ischnura elegans]
MKYIGMDSSRQLITRERIKEESSHPGNPGTSVQNANLSSSSTSGYVSGQDEDAGRGCDREYVPDSVFSSDNPFFSSENAVAISTVEDLSSAVERCKARIFESPECSEERKWLVRNLIELQIFLQEKKEVEKTDVDSTNSSYGKMRIVMGHHFILQKQINAKHYCERCSGVIWGMVHSWYQCRDCSYCCHLKCVTNVCRICAHVKASEDPVYVMKICPEVGLSMQSYRCAECKTHITFVPKGLSCFGRPFSSDNMIEPRRCDYDGKYYCHSCHWNALSVIPARVIHNWDFEERRVCQSSKQFLTLMAKRPVLKLEELNPLLFNFVTELGDVKKVREDILIMKKYFVSCKNAIDNRILWKLQDRLHFAENVDSYSLQDLIDLNSGELLTYLQSILEVFEKHIKQDCQLCSGKGYICEFCKVQIIIFPFDKSTITCQKCQSVFHKYCWTTKNQQCPKCERVFRRNLESLDNLSLEDT